MAELIMMVGISASGKSTIAHELAEQERAKVFSSDDIREELWGDVSIQKNPQKVFNILHQRVINTLNEGKNCIYDATNLNSKRRGGICLEVVALENE